MLVLGFEGTKMSIRSTLYHLAGACGFIFLFGCVGGTDSTQHTPVTTGIEGDFINLRLRTAPAGNFKKVSVVFSSNGISSGVFSMLHDGIVHNGDEYVYRYALPMSDVSPAIQYKFTFTHSGREDERIGGTIRIQKKQ